MSRFWRRFLLGLGLLALGGGCNPLNPLFMIPFYMFSDEPKLPAEYYKLEGKDKEKPIKVVILTYMADTPAGFLQADREVTRYFAKHLQELCKENKENIKIVNPSKVEEFKNKNPDWGASHVELENLGKQFKADYVVYMEINRLSMYQPGSGGQFYRGTASMTIKLVNVKKPDDFTTVPRDFTFSYPSEARIGSIMADADTPPDIFKHKFLDKLGARLSWLFAERPTQNSYMEE